MNGRIPYGLPVRRVEQDHPLLMRCPIIIEASPGEMNRIFLKMWDYRLWYHLGDLPGISRGNDEGNIVKTIQDHYNTVEAADPDFAEGVTSVTILFSKSLETTVTKQLAHLPSPIVTKEEPFRKKARKVLHVRNKKGTEKSLPLFEEILDIDAERKDMFIVLNNPADSPWEILASDSPTNISMFSPEMMNSNEISEEITWNKVSLWILKKKITISEEQKYPNGENEFPDYRAAIKGTVYDIEITSVPDLGKWTIKAGYQNLEETIQRVAKQPGETLADVSKEVIRILEKKSSRVQSNPCILVITNWSSYSLYDISFWKGKDLSKFCMVIVVERDNVWSTDGKNMAS